ncbi:sigma 54-interacting transcriptional regulator [Pediococcus inopinatus]|uniref:Sigma 54-interacting transcriptional regulator n=1 Tax=Pediococcus inopinatus TaxID=114090 RepID=A0ABZ0Q5G4_9LACO|nr:sigma-54-dependent transcriptional regulator [Pediococcus inopinatus]WPC19692.1 sigma 54-interacting transcriptional regulator [Pediococcus inopinatus]WPC21388.1 sigma 54-interacting transcriptional regulator [Pediococcus inopinatus]WPP09669.1 sigma 54-interacting transcriptional regulator [Pediococcus inopinatus]
MKRKDRIYQYIVEKTTPDETNQLTGAETFTTEQVADELDLIRSNVSKELNQLVREEKLTKLAGRPVRYCRRGAAQEPEKEVITSPLSAGKRRIHSGLEHTEKPKKSAGISDVFEHMIGNSSSMRNQIEQAKAAILYPPRGLNTLVIGPTGSGKTYFANAMFQFAQNRDLIKKDDQLITFNCADYSHNPELLMSHLFGYVKGAFTGADEEKDGLIQEADNGMLFLDEVHRLPPEGQEMIFYFMDHGTYSKLGETSKIHHANVRLVCATTEDPESSLLKTFVRRIPITIQLPAFNKRSAKERVELLKVLLSLEANRTHKQITLTEDVVQSLLGSVTYGNVGQLKSNIQLVCARGFLNSIENENEIVITVDDLPPNIKDGLVHLAANRRDSGEISKLLEPYMTIQPDSDTHVLTNRNDSYELPYNLYEIIGDKATLLRQQGLDQEHINHFITTDINLHLKTFSPDEDDTRGESKLAEIVNQDIIDFTKETQVKIEKILDYNFRDNFLYAMSLHISSFIKRIQSGKPMRTMSRDLIAMVEEYPDEMKVAQKIKAQLENRYNVPIPESESYYLAILLVSLKVAPTSGKVGIVVAAHGSSTATSMVQVVSQLLSDNTIQSFDMPLDMNPKTAYKDIVECVNRADEGNGVLLLVDMGSLSTFGTKITEETHIPVKTIDMVTTAMVLEAARKASFIETDLAAIYSELREFRGYSRVNASTKKEELPNSSKETNSTSVRPKAIVAICSTGEGTAKKIQSMLDQLLVENLIEDIKVIPISLVNMDEHIHSLQTEYQIIATTGVTHPGIQVPFMPLQNLLEGGGERFLDKVLERDSLSSFDSHQDMKLTKEVCAQYLDEFYTFINPHKITDVLWQYIDQLQADTNKKFSEPFKINLIMHIAGAIERSLTNGEISASDAELKEMVNSKWYSAVKAVDDMYLHRIRIELPPEEVYYIVKLLESWQVKDETVSLTN